MLDKCGSSADLEVDGGVNIDTVGEVVAAGANAFVAGSAVFNDKHSVEENVRLLRDRIASYWKNIFVLFSALSDFFFWASHLTDANTVTLVDHYYFSTSH